VLRTGRRVDTSPGPRTRNSKATTYAYDDADRLTSVTDASNNLTQCGYDTEGNLTSIFAGIYGRRDEAGLAAAALQNPATSS
jgi:YD repeat-containing protein